MLNAALSLKEYDMREEWDMRVIRVKQYIEDTVCVCVCGCVRAHTWACVNIN